MGRPMSHKNYRRSLKDAVLKVTVSQWSLIVITVFVITEKLGRTGNMTA